MSVTLTFTSLLPSPAAVATLLTGIIGRPVAVSEDPGLDLDTPGSAYCGVYRDDLGTPQFACIYDLDLAAHAGAALLLLPPARARDSVAIGHLEATIEENVREILNIQARVFSVLANRHIHLAEMIGRMESVPVRLLRLMPQPLERADFMARIQGYGSGRMAIIRLVDPLGRPDDGPVDFVSRL